MSEKVKLANIHASIEKAKLFTKIVSRIITGITVIGSIWVFMKGLGPIIAGTPEQITALAEFVKQFNISHILSWTITALTGGAYYMERKGKKRAIKEKQKYQQIAEAKEPNRSSSNLTNEGDTPPES